MKVRWAVAVIGIIGALALVLILGRNVNHDRVDESPTEAEVITTTEEATPSLFVTVFDKVGNEVVVEVEKLEAVGEVTDYVRSFHFDRATGLSLYDALSSVDFDQTQIDGVSIDFYFDSEESAQGFTAPANLSEVER